MSDSILKLDQYDLETLAKFLENLGLTMKVIPTGETIPGSFWGDEEAGLIKNTIYVRPDTPLHSVMHETGHYVCMDPERRAGLDTNAGGTYPEENAVCYWQIAVTDHLPDIDREKMCQDMDAWGYTFRLGSAAKWFAEDAEDAQAWLRNFDLLDGQGQVRLQVRDRV